MKLIALAALGGGIGSALRYALAIGITKIAPASFPWAILTINVVGCFAMGVLVAALALKLNGSSEARVFLATGVLGGFTTFSAFSLEVFALLTRGDLVLALAYAVSSVAGSVVALYVGVLLVRG